MRFCNQCGAELAGAEQFCSACGHRLSADPAPSGKRAGAKWLLVLALLALLAGWGLWAAADRSARTLAEAPNHVPAVAAFVVAGLMFLGSLIMFAGSDAPAVSDETPAREWYG